MSKTTTLTVRLDPQVKREAQEVLDRLGISASQAITMYFNQIREEKGLPFRPHIPNAETLAAIQDAMEGKNLKDFDSLDGLFTGLGLPRA